MTAEDVGVVVDRVAKASLAPLIERVRLSTESKLGALAKKVEEMERRQREIGEDVAALRQLLQAKAGGGGAPNGSLPRRLILPRCLIPAGRISNIAG